jgi:hypothetical protein
MRRLRFHFVFAACCGTSLTLFSWLLLFSLSSPAGAYIYGFVHLIPFILAQKLSGSEVPSEFVYWTLLFGQWFIVGFCVSLLFWKSRGQNDAA